MNVLCVCVCVSSLYVLVLFAFISMTSTGKHNDSCLLVKDTVHLVFVATTERGGGLLCPDPPRSASRGHCVSLSENPLTAL